MRKALIKDPQIDLFKARLERHRLLIDGRIATFVLSLESEIAEQYGELPLVVTHTFTDYLQRGGKRIRGSLTMVAYELFGGTDQAMILEAALAIEMLQAYILMLDDIQDRSETRRGGPTAHIMMRDYHKKNHLRDDALHFGESMAMNALSLGCHLALEIIAGLNVEPSRLLKALKNINRYYVTTCYGQTLDIFNEAVGAVSEQDVDNVLIWKTASYTFINPLHFGAILAGADDENLQRIYDYSIPAGKAFQITDDILGIYGEESESGKSPLDDIKEGKRTVLTLKALELAPAPESYFLEQCLGKHDLTMAEFKNCQKIISESGALDYARTMAENAVEEAVSAIRTSSSGWDTESVNFLSGLVRSLLDRRA